ncbi:MAG: zinc-binding dehydrogenase [Planctomycetota bacterium]|nr:zinc-binding dehydrogenase [Planctomycetota bacterium]
MQAVQINAHGGPEVLEIVDIPRPEPGPGEVLCKVLAVSVNHLDIWVRRGMPGFDVPFPRIPGCDGTGEVVAVGPGVQSTGVGQKVLLEPGYNEDLNSPEVKRGEDYLAADYGLRGEHCDGFDAEYVVLPERYVTPLPPGLDPIQAAATPLVFLTAWGMLMERARVRSGETVLVLAAGSGVGSAAIQIAKAEGATVIATGGCEEKLQVGLDLGADHVIDHCQEHWSKEVKRLTGGRGVDLVVEHVGPATWAESMRSMARNGRLVTCGGTTGPKVDVILPHLFIKNLAVMGSTMGPRSAFPLIMERLAAGIYKPVLNRTMPMSQVAEAHRVLEDRGVVGKIVLIPGQ